jgi:hypothetical protein
MEHGWKIIFLVLVLIYEFVVSPRICKRMIIRHISSMGGEVIDIERLTLREFLYSVDYRRNGKAEKAVVQFNIFYHGTWRW